MASTKFLEVETRMRRILRDTNARVFSSNLLKDCFNRALEQLAKDGDVLQDVVAMHWPPQCDYATTGEWENDYVKGYIRTYGLQGERDDWRCSYTWEIEQKAGYAPESVDNTRVTAPWEGYIDNVDNVMDRDLAAFPHDFEAPIMVTYDNERLEPIHEDQAKSGDNKYRTRSGTPVYYYRVNEFEFAPLPRPNEIAWDNIDVTTEIVDYGYNYDWEEAYVEALSSGAGKVTATYEE